jgi:HK97 family phage portal protein
MRVKYETKAIVTVPAWAQAMHEGTGTQLDTINNAAAAYAFVPLVYRAVRLRADALTRVPIHFTKLDGETEAKSPFDVDWKDLIWKTEAALDLHGANYIEKIPRLRSKKTGALQWINPLTMTARMVKQPDGSTAYQFQQGTNGAKWTLEDMVYMREFSLSGDILPNGDIQPGDSPTRVSLNDAALIRYMSRFAARFFETGAMPITVLQIDGIVDKDEAQRIEGFFKRAATRIRNAFNVLALGRAIEPKIISQPLKDLVMPELNEQARHAVSLAFGIPQTMLEDAANFATSKEHRLSFWQDTMQPRGEWLAEQFNRQVLAPLGIQMRFGFEELDIFQEDENERGATLQAMVTAVSTNPAVASWAMGVLGYDLNDEQQKELDELVAKKEEQSPTTTTPPTNTPAAETVAEQSPAKAVWMDDLGRWERKALRVLKESGSAVCEYVSDVLPAEIRAKVAARLAECKTAEEVKALFDMQPVTVTPVTEYKSSPDTMALAESINRLAEAYIKSIQATQESEQTNKESEK